MLGRARGSGLNHRQRWWREKRPLQIEEQACALIRQYEAEHGRIAGIVVPPALLVPEVGCELVYFADEERAGYLIPADAIGALDVDERLVLVHDGITTPGREAHTIGEEIGHAMLHAKLLSPDQQALGLDVSATPRRYHRTEGSAFQDGQHEPVWMTAEAGYFAACLQMPRDRWGEAARAGHGGPSDAAHSTFPPHRGVGVPGRTARTAMDDGRGRLLLRLPADAARPLGGGRTRTSGTGREGESALRQSVPSGGPETG